MAPRKKRNQAGEDDGKWETSKAKQLVRVGFIDDSIPLDMPLDDIRALNPEVHEKWPVDQWKRNVRNLRNAIQRDKDRAMEDWMSYQIDLNTLTKIQAADNRKVPWHLSEAVKHLKRDMNEGKHLQMKPKELYMTRSAYQEYDLTTFRKHIYQLRDAEAKRAWRFEKKMRTAKYPEVYEDHPRYATHISSKK